MKPYQLHLHIETLFLLIHTPWREKRIDALKELETTGVDGAAFYHQNGAIVERYYAAFEKERVASPGAQLLAEADPLTQSIYFHIVWHHPEWVKAMDTATDQELSEAVNSQIILALGGQEDIITGLDTLGVSATAKWQAMVLLQKPRQQLSAVFGAVAANTPAAEHAQGSVAKDMGELWDQFGKLAENTYGTWPLDVSKLLHASAPIIPMLAMPFSVLYTDDAFFCGLLCYKLFQSAGGEFSKEELIVCAKALSDKSKVEILLCLKEESLNGLEIAEKLALTPATISHHMGILLASGFVELEKRGRSTYYHLSKIGLQKFLSGAGQLLL